MDRLLFKRFFDFFSALFLLIVFSPIILIVFLFLLIANNGNALFFQTRPGFHGVPFVIFKFKTMRDGVDAKGNLLPDEIRLISRGKKYLEHYRLMCYYS
jgi:undecaprenyl phosphate N,N'-diacetylbacillosamine 1-phosphate transferase